MSGIEKSLENRGFDFMYKIFIMLLQIFLLFFFLLRKGFSFSF